MSEQSHKISPPGGTCCMSQRKLASASSSTASIFKCNMEREVEILTKKIKSRFVELKKGGAATINDLGKLCRWVEGMMEEARMAVEKMGTAENLKKSYQEVSKVLVEVEDNIAMLAASIARWKIGEIDSGENDVTNRHKVKEEVVKESVGRMAGKKESDSFIELNNETTCVKTIKNELKNCESSPNTSHKINSPDKERPGSSVVFVSNLDTEFMDCDSLFNLFSIYGPVKRIQFLKSALVEAQFQNALVELDNKAGAERVIEFLGKTLKIEPSYVLNVTDLGLSLPNGSKAFKEFHQDFYPVTMYSPSRTLHFFGIPILIKEDFYKVFGKLGAPVPYKVMWFSNMTGKGLLQFKSKKEALKAICIVNNAKISAGRRSHLAFTYTRKDLDFHDL